MWTGPPAALNLISIDLHILIKMLNLKETFYQNIGLTAVNLSYILADGDCGGSALVLFSFGLQGLITSSPEIK
jgi:hypothetical protein